MGNSSGNETQLAQLFIGSLLMNVDRLVYDNEGKGSSIGVARGWRGIFTTRERGRGRNQKLAGERGKPVFCQVFGTGKIATFGTLCTLGTGFGWRGDSWVIAFAFTQRLRSVGERFPPSLSISQSKGWNWNCERESSSRKIQEQNCERGRTRKFVVAKYSGSGGKSNIR